jgi:adenylate cyclase
MTVVPRRLVVLCGLVPTLVVSALCVYRPSSLAGIDWRIYDMMVRAAATRPPDGRIVIVDVDERSLTTVGQWPWRRDLIARLIGNLRDLGASIVALDIVFAESDRYGEGGDDPDDVLANALHKGQVVLGYALTFDDPRELRRECVHHPLGLAIIQGADEDSDEPYFRASASVCNLPNLARAAGASGYMNAVPDVDGILRRVPLVVELEGHVYPALALAAVSAATGTRGVALRVANVDASTLLISRERDRHAESAEAGSDVHVPVDGKSNLLLRYRGVKHTFP